MSGGAAVLAVTSLAVEARIALGPGVSVVCHHASRLLASLEAAIKPGTLGIISFGIAGGLAPDLTAGDWVIASRVRFGEERHPVDERWARQLLRALPGAVHAEILGADAPIATSAHKRQLHHQTGAAAVDMESHIVASVGLAEDVPFAAIRVITDPAQRALPPSAIAAMRPNGTTDFAAMFRSVLRRPRDLPALLQTALDARAARASLVRGRYWLDPALA